jgi:hypothetical protein
MIHRPSLLLLLVSLSASALRSQQRDQDPVLDGYVTRVVSLTDFDVNGFHVVLKPRASIRVKIGPYQTQNSTTPPPLGQAASVTGHLKKKQHQILAQDVLFHSPDTGSRSGIAIVDRVLLSAQPGNLSRLLLRADGYVILIRPTAKTVFKPPLKSNTDVTEGIWIKYHGKPQADGLLLADSANFASNDITDDEAHLLDKNDYDPAAVPVDSKQNIAKTLILGTIDPKKIPPYNDPAMQARINRIGASLIPSYQRSLPDSDQRKILFKFQLIDAQNWKNALSLPSGIILVPFELVDRLQNDSQIATLLADNMAAVLEKQQYRIMPAEHELLGTGVIATGAGLFVPGLGSVAAASGASAVTFGAEKKIESDLLNQSGRVSLGLLHDAGYDINQAPITWLILNKNSVTNLSVTTMPSRSANLYQSLASTWRNYPDAPIPTTTLENRATVP